MKFFTIKICCFTILNDWHQYRERSRSPEIEVVGFCWEPTVDPMGLLLPEHDFLFIQAAVETTLIFSDFYMDFYYPLFQVFSNIYLGACELELKKNYAIKGCGKHPKIMVSKLYQKKSFKGSI